MEDLQSAEIESKSSINHQAPRANLLTSEKCHVGWGEDSRRGRLDLNITSEVESIASDG